MTNEMKSESYTRLKLSPEDAKAYFEKKLSSNAGVEIVQLVDALVDACSGTEVAPTYLSSGANVVFYCFHKRDEWKTKEKFNLLQIATSGEVKGSRFLQIQCNHKNVQLDKAIWANHWTGLGRITGAGNLVSMPSPTVRDQHKFRTEGNNYPYLVNLLGKDSEHVVQVASHLAETASKIKKALS
jgi:hypothetical protein